MHHPPFSISLHGGQRELRERWTPLFERYNVTAVFSGHDHVYSRAEHGGVQYFVTGGGGAPLYPRGRRLSKIDKKATRYFERVNHFLRVHIIGDLVEISAIRTDGTLIETISWGSPPKLVRPASAVAASESAAVATDSTADGAALDPAADPTVPAVGAGADPQATAAAMAQAPAASREAARASPVPGRFGFMGKLGALLMLFAGATLVWSLRR